MIRRSDAFAREGGFWRQMKVALNEGIRDLQTGYDRVAYDWLDPRVQGGQVLSFALTRALAGAWRTHQGQEPLPVVVMAGRITGGRLEVREVPLDAWPSLDEIHFASDGPSALTEQQALTRRLRIDDGEGALQELFGVAEVPGDLTLTSSILGGEAGDYLINAAAEKIGMDQEDGVGILMLYQANPGPVDIGDAGGPSRNGFHPALSATRHMSDSHLSGSYLRLMTEEVPENWYDEGFRTRLFEGLKVAAAERGFEITKQAFLDSLAEGSPLRRILPHHLTRFFPEAERIFWCLPESGLLGIDPIVWDESSPLERLSILSAVKVDAYLG